MQTIKYITKANLQNANWMDKNYNQLGSVRHPILNKTGYQIAIDNTWSLADQVELINEAIAAARGETLL